MKNHILRDKKCEGCSAYGFSPQAHVNGDPRHLGLLHGEYDADVGIVSWIGCDVCDPLSFNRNLFVAGHKHPIQSPDGNPNHGDGCC